MSTAMQEREPNPDPFAEFRRAFAKYQRKQAAFDSYEEQIGKTGGVYVGSQSWKKLDLVRRVASEGLWVSGVSGYFNLLGAGNAATPWLGMRRKRSRFHDFTNREEILGQERKHVHIDLLAEHGFQQVAESLDVRDSVSGPSTTQADKI